MAINLGKEYTSVEKENCKNTRKDDDGMKKLQCICGCSRIEARVSAEIDREGCGRWLIISCKNCRKTLFYNGA
jgi:hypothetical protein